MQAGLQMTIIMIQLQLKGEAIYILLGVGGWAWMTIYVVKSTHNFQLRYLKLIFSNLFIFREKQRFL